MCSLRSGALLLLALPALGLTGRPALGSGGVPPAPGATAEAVDEGAWMWARLGVRISSAEEEKHPTNRRRLYRVFSPRRVIAVRKNGLADLAGVKVGANAVLVPQGDTGHINMSTGRAIRTVFHPSEEVLHIHTVISGPWKITVTGQRPGVARLVLTDVDGKEEEVIAVVVGKAK
jgi:hypothetical protein